MNRVIDNSYPAASEILKKSKMKGKKETHKIPTLKRDKREDNQKRPLKKPGAKKEKKKKKKKINYFLPINPKTKMNKVTRLKYI